MLTEEEARRLAEEELRFNIGTFPHISEFRYSEKAAVYVAELSLSYPRPPVDEDDELTFDPAEVIGEIQVDAETGEVTRTPLDVIEARAGEIADRE